jgi:hypothetical protein
MKTFNELVTEVYDGYGMYMGMDDYEDEEDYQDEGEYDYEGDMASTRLIIWNLEFTARSYIWPAIKEESYIRSANANVYIETTTTSNVTTNNLSLIFHTESDNAAAMIDDEFGFADSITYLV